jgi:PIN domain nuclease of toxin-antitoxin system
MLLLDCQALLWLLDDNPRLGPRARQAITSAQGVHVSAATVWELTIKAMLGQLSVPADLSARLTAQGLELLSIAAGHAEVICDFPELAGTTRSTAFW